MLLNKLVHENLKCESWNQHNIHQVKSNTKKFQIFFDIFL